MNKLSEPAQRAVAEAVRRFEADPFDPRLRTHKLGGRLANHWAFSAGYDLRIVCRIDGDQATLLAVDSHDDVY